MKINPTLLSSITLTVIATVVLVGGGTYVVARNQISKTSYKQGHDAGWKAGYAKGKSDGDVEGVVNTAAKQIDLDTMTKNYNDLVDQVNQYNASVGRRAITCSSVNYGITGQYTNTTCY
jgi:hypothetical protein